MQRRVDVALQHVGQPPPGAVGPAAAISFDQARPSVLPVKAHQSVEEVVNDCTNGQISQNFPHHAARNAVSVQAQSPWMHDG